MEKIQPVNFKESDKQFRFESLMGVSLPSWFFGITKQRVLGKFFSDPIVRR